MSYEEHTQPPIAVVILNWNGMPFFERFLPTLIQNTPADLAKIVIVDNASIDDSLNYLQTQHPDLQIVTLDKNYGFAGGYNRGLAQITAKYFMLLNSDVEVTAEWLRPLYDLMESDASIAACGPKLLDFNDRHRFEYAGAAGGFIDKYGYPFCRGRIFDTCEVDTGQYNTPCDCLWISGAALMIRSQAFNSVGGFDNDFFAHQEEIDLCWRLKLAGHRIVCQPKSSIFHVGGGTLNKSNPKKTYFNFRNNLFMIQKNLPKKERRKVKLVRLVLDIIAVARMLLQRNIKEAAAVRHAYRDFGKLKKIMNAKQKSLNPVATKNYKEIFNGNIVCQYFIKKKKTFDKYFSQDVTH